jgi:hypothetical protein
MIPRAPTAAGFVGRLGNTLELIGIGAMAPAPSYPDTDFSSLPLKMI